MSYVYKPAEAGILSKANLTHEQAIAYLVQGAISPEALGQWQRDREAAASIGSGGNGKITFKVSRKGAVSVYGLQRMPVTLYAEQWERFLADGGKALLAYIASNPTTQHAADGANPAVTATIQRKNGVKIAA